MPVRRLLLSSVLLACGASLAADTPGPQPALMRAQALLAQGQRAEARQELAAALRAFPAHPVLHNFLGVIEAQDDHPAAAEGHFREAIRLRPRYTDAYLNLGRLYQEAAPRRPEAAGKALAAYEAVLAYEPGQAEALYQSAVLLQAQGDSVRALERLSRLPDDQQQRAQVLALRLAAAMGAGRTDDVDRSAEQLLDRPDLTEADVRTVSPALAAKGRADVVIRLLERLRARGVASPEALRQLAGAYETSGRLDAARDAYEAAAAARTDSVPLLVDLARVAQAQGDRTGALGYLAHARQLDPKDARLHFAFGMLCVELNLGVEAHSALKEAAALDPGNAAINYAMGAVSLHRREPAEAVPFFRKYAELRPGDPRGALAVGLAWFQARDFAAARPELTRAAQSPTTAAAANYFLARIAREEDDGPAALALAEKAIALEPSYADAWAERGLLHLRRRDLAAAEQDLRKCLELDPDNLLGNLHLLALYQRARDPRQEAQAVRVKELEALRAEKTEEFRRVIEVQPH
jgi:tetratricopeptide (TPR) repeat protein